MAIVTGSGPDLSRAAKTLAAAPSPRCSRTSPQFAGPIAGPTRGWQGGRETLGRHRQRVASPLLLPDPRNVAPRARSCTQLSSLRPAYFTHKGAQAGPAQAVLAGPTHRANGDFRGITDRHFAPRRSRRWTSAAKAKVFEFSRRPLADGCYGSWAQPRVPLSRDARSRGIISCAGWKIR